MRATALQISHECLPLWETKPFSDKRSGKSAIKNSSLSSGSASNSSMKGLKRWDFVRRSAERVFFSCTYSRISFGVGFASLFFSK